MGYLFSALTGKIAHFNSINQPIDNGIGAKIRALEESPEKLLLICAFGLAQEVVSEMFHPDNGIFRKSVDSLTYEKLEKIYHTLMDISVSSITQIPLFNEEVKNNVINSLAVVLGSKEEKKRDDVKTYSEAESGVMKAYETVCSILAMKEDPQSAIPFGTTYMKVYNDVMTKLGQLIYNQ